MKKRKKGSIISDFLGGYMLDYTVTTRAKSVKQPRGGYLKPSSMQKIVFEDGKELGDENINPGLVGSAVDCLTDYMDMFSDVSTNAERHIKTKLLMGMSNFFNKEYFIMHIFSKSYLGYKHRESFFGKDSTIIRYDYDNGLDAKSLINGINGLDDDSIIAACRLAAYDIWMWMNPKEAMNALASVEHIVPDASTIENIRVMVKRSITFFSQFGPIIEAHNSMHIGGDSIINAGEYDYLTKDTLWDFKVSKKEPNNKQTLQILIYWIMGMHSNLEFFDRVEKIGIYNPRLNTAYIKAIKDIPEETITTICKDVICYKEI